MHAEKTKQVHKAERDVPESIERVECGEQIIEEPDSPGSKIRRTGRGSLRGHLVITEEWDSDQVNQSIADDFGMPM